MLIDARIIARHGAREILAQRQEILWDGGTQIWLHSVRSHGLPDLFLRAAAIPGGRWLLFDLRQLVPKLDEDLRRTLDRDVPGMVFYTLRQAFVDGSAFRNAVALLGDVVTPDLVADEPVPAPSGFADSRPMRFQAEQARSAA